MPLSMIISVAYFPNPSFSLSKISPMMVSVLLKSSKLSCEDFGAEFGSVSFGFRI